MKRIKITGIIMILILSFIPQLCQADDWDITAGTLFNFDTEPVDESVLAKIDDTHFLCVYATNTYWMPPTVNAVAAILTVDTATGTITRENDPFIFDYEWGLNPAISKIDNSHYLCTFSGLDGVGKSVVLTVDLDTWVITTETFFVFETDQACYPVLSKIDDSVPGIDFYLCAYSYWNAEGAGKSVVLTVDTSTWTIDMIAPFEFQSSPIETPTLSKIDDNHFLCAYVYETPTWDYFGRAVVLTVDTDTWTINLETPFDFEENYTWQPALSKIDENHYLCAYAYETPTWDMFGKSVVLTVDTDTWTINQEIPFDSGMEIASPSLSKLDDEHYLSAFALGSWEPVGASIVLNIDNDTWEITQVSDLIFDPTTMRGSSPYLSQIDDRNYLCTYNTLPGGPEGWSVILNVEFPPVGIDDNQIVSHVADLSNNYPNPFNPETTINYQLPENSRVELSVFNLKGQKVKTLINETLESGNHTVIWNGTDNNDKSVSSGIYFYKMKTDNHEETKKMILMK